jgi:hypothetical protein
MQKIIGFDLYDPPPPSTSSHRVNLVKSESDHTPIAKDVSLQELYDNHLGPGKLLYMTQKISKKLSENYEKMRDERVPEQVNNYAIVNAHTIEVKVKTAQVQGNQLGGLKGVHMVLANPVEYTKEALDRAYQFIEHGSPVEFRVRLLGAVVKKKMKSTPASADAWPWMHAHFPHLRPDFILKTMPEGTDYLIKPVSDGRTIQFVLSKKAKVMPKLDLTNRVFRVKKAVIQTLGKPSAVMGPSVSKELRENEDEKAVEKELQKDRVDKDTVGGQSVEGELTEEGDGDMVSVKTLGESSQVESVDEDEILDEEEQRRRDGLGRMRAVKAEMRKWRKQYQRESGVEKEGK